MAYWIVHHLVLLLLTICWKSCHIIQYLPLHHLNGHLCVCSCSPERHWWLKLQDDITLHSQWRLALDNYQVLSKCQKYRGPQKQEQFLLIYFFNSIIFKTHSLDDLPRPHDLTPSNYSNNPIVATPQTWDHTDTHVIFLVDSFSLDNMGLISEKCRFDQKR